MTNEKVLKRASSDRTQRGQTADEEGDGREAQRGREEGGPFDQLEYDDRRCVDCDVQMGPEPQPEGKPATDEGFSSCAWIFLRGRPAASRANTVADEPAPR